MDLTERGNTIPGLPQYLYYGQFDRVDELNSRILERDVPDKPLAPNFSPRPVTTKYSLFPMLDARMPATVPIEPNYNYNLSTTFTPPVMKRGPVSGFINHVNVESELRNQGTSLQKGADQGVYVPSSNSDLYKVYVPSRPSEQPHPELFRKEQFDARIHPNIANAPQIGIDRFNNNTRVQLRNIVNN
jgi:hypothetical protein